MLSMERSKCWDDDAKVSMTYQLNLCWKVRKVVELLLQVVGRFKLLVDNDMFRCGV